MPIPTTLVLCSCLYASNPTGPDATRQDICLVSIQQQVAAIKANPLSDKEKGLKLAVFITKGMADEEVERRLGEPEEKGKLAKVGGPVLSVERSYKRYHLWVGSEKGKVTEIKLLP